MADKYLSRRGLVDIQWDNYDETYTYQVQIMGSMPRMVLKEPEWAGQCIVEVEYRTDIPTTYVKIKSSAPTLLGKFIYLMWEGPSSG